VSFLRKYRKAVTHRRRAAVAPSNEKKGRYSASRLMNTSY
jgi:hypothetical protein